MICDDTILDLPQKVKLPLNNKMLFLILFHGKQKTSVELVGTYTH